MSNQRYTLLPSESLSGDVLAELALDVSCSWRHTERALWSQLNQDFWERTRNPWAVLQTVSGEKLERITAQPAFRAALNDVQRIRSQEERAPRWFPQAHPQSPLTCVAYFSMEYMLSEALPIYSGGLGNVAGDQLKAANDLGVPVVGVGLLYSLGYFRQELDRDGRQRALYPYNDPGQLPVRPLRDPNGDWLRLCLPFFGCDLWIRAWEVQVGRTKLYLLDSNDPANLPEHRSITSELYGGGPDNRLKQEIVLGIGGWRLLRALEIRPEVCHLNEGHAAFAVLERAASYMEEAHQSFPVAMTVTRAGNLFTTHTAVEAGFDRFPVDLMRANLSQYCADLHIAFDQVMALGRSNPGDTSEPFNMAYLALHGSNRVNGVSRLHGAVSRKLFGGMFPRWPVAEVPIGYVTNGVHVPTWDSDQAHQLWAGVCGHRCWHGDLEHLEKNILQSPDAPIWTMRNQVRRCLVDYIRTHYSRQSALQGAPSREITEAAEIFNYTTLTLGFARRFATYKRPSLLLRDPERLLRILHHPQHPVQLVLAGKAHPQDGAGQDMIRQWNDFIRRSGTRAVVFLSDYDMLMTEQLVSGVDVWINTPRRPWEASGTSGMKVLVNGGLNLSALDGWWVEAYTQEVGWAIGDGGEHGDDPGKDNADADALYALLEREIVPQFYERNAAGIPEKWVARIRDSMARLTPEYSANRVVREYTDHHYTSAATDYNARAGQGGKVGVELHAWQQDVAAKWNGVAFGPLRIESNAGQHHFEIPVHLAGLNPDAVRVELFAEGLNGGDPVRNAMDRGVAIDGSGFLYAASVAGDRPASDFTPRIVPSHPAASVPLEAGQILWQK